MTSKKKFFFSKDPFLCLLSKTTFKIGKYSTSLLFYPCQAGENLLQTKFFVHMFDKPSLDLEPNSKTICSKRSKDQNLIRISRIVSDISNDLEEYWCHTGSCYTYMVNKFNQANNIFRPEAISLLVQVIFFSISDSLVE